MRGSLLPLAAVVVTLFWLTVPAGAALVTEPACGDFVTADVVLTTDLVCQGAGLTAAGGIDVTIDLNGHSLVGSGTGVGVQMSGGNDSHVTVENGSIRGFETGIAVTNYPHDGATVQLERLLIRNNHVGVRGDQGAATTLADSTISANTGDGVVVAFDRPFQMIRDLVSNNGGRGIRAFEDSLSLLQDSFVAHNAREGAYLTDTVAAISGNTFLGNGSTGLSIQERNCGFFPLYDVSDNVADRNGSGGMSMAFYLAPPEFCPSLAPPPGTGNAAKHNADFQCVLIVCAFNRGQARNATRRSDAHLQVHQHPK